MTTDELLDRMGRVYNLVDSRVGTLGEKEYANGGVQSFEGKTFTSIGQDILEEIQDTIAYLTFLHIRIEKLVNKVNNVEAD
jgi:hypothetical protein